MENSVELKIGETSSINLQENLVHRERQVSEELRAMIEELDASFEDSD